MKSLHKNIVGRENNWYKDKWRKTNMETSVLHALRNSRPNPKGDLGMF
jgi:hypothetical protein